MENVYVKIGRQLRPLLFLLALALSLSAQGDTVRSGDNGYRLIDLKTDTLPSLNVARSGHTTFYLDSGLIVFGGHTDGFIPTATAEYLCGDTWHTVPLAYPHDSGIGIKLRSGKVFLAGGHKEALGIGQLFSAELFDPATHSSQGFGCMDKKRAFANAIEMSDGQVVITGNWYEDDEIEMFANVYDPFKPNAVKVKDVSMARANPYIFRISDDDAIIFGALNNQGEPIDEGIVDRLKGASYREPFLSTWHPLPTAYAQRSYNNFIGNEAEGHYAWLLPVENDETGRVAIARVEGAKNNSTNATFSLLLTQPMPDSINGKRITYTSLVCDRERKLAYLIGENDEARIFAVCIPYDAPDKSPLTIYVTEPQPIIAQSNSPVLTPEGDLIFAGGHLINNFSPSSTVIRLPLGHIDNATAIADISSGNASWWIVISLLLSCVIAAAIYIWRKNAKAIKSPTNDSEADENIEDASLDKNLPKDEILADLFRRIEQLMNEEQLYLNSNLRASDVATRVGSNTAYVSAAINSQCGYSFSQYLTSYRISYAQELMRQDPEIKISAISTLSGFSTDSTFFRAFRSITGMSPKEWLSTNKNEHQ